MLAGAAASAISCSAFAQGAPPTLPAPPTTPGVEPSSQMTPGASTPAGSATNPQDSGALSEVTVTARKRSESLQRVPEPISVVDATELQRATVNTIQDVAALTPGLVIYDQLRPGEQTVSLRGFTTVQGGQLPFATIIDGVQLPGMEFLKQQLIDVDRVEVVRGPQGTLYGGGAIAGAVNIVTKKPTDDYTAAIKLGIADGTQRQGALTASGPILKDKLYFRFSLFAINDDGLIPNLGQPKNADFSIERAAQGEILFTPTDRLTIDLWAHYTKGKDGAVWLVKANDNDFENFSALPDTDLPNEDHRRVQTYSTKVEYQLTDSITATSITSVNRADQYVFADGDFSDAPLFGQTWATNTLGYNEELRFVSGEKQRLRWVGGVFGQYYRVYDQTQFGSEISPTSFDYFAIDPNLYKHASFAVFGQASYDITSRLEGTVGVRYDSDHATARNLADPTGALDGKVFSEWQPKVQLAYKFTPDLLTYISYGKGFRTGGFNPLTPISVRIYKDEVSKNYEAGFKSTWLNRRLTFNGAAFHTDFDNQQFYFSEATDAGIYRVITNIPKTAVNGVEGEVAARPVRDLLLHGSVGYSNTIIKKFDTGEYDGDHTPQVYGLTSNASVEYNFHLPHEIEVVPRVDVEHRGDVYWDLADTVRTAPKTFLNLRLEVDYSRYTLAAYCRNATDERTPAAVGADAIGPGVSLRSYNEPRRAGLEAIARF